MANPIQFTPKTEPLKELQNRLAAAPREHAEALLVAYDVLQSAHDEGLLDLAQGAIASKNAIFGKIAEYAKQKESTNALRNLLSLARLLGSIDPEALSAAAHTAAPGPKPEPPSLWKLMRRFTSAEGRRGLARAADLLVAFGGSK